MGRQRKSKKIISWISLTFLFFILFSCSKERVNNERKKEQIIGVKIYARETSFPGLFKEWRSLGINTAFVSISLGSNKEFMELASRSDISTFIIVPVFYNPEVLQKRPNLFAITNTGEKANEEWVSFVCPSREGYRKQRIAYIKDLVRQLYPDGLSLDFIRYFVFWEKIYPDRTLNSIANSCFDSDCLDKFQKETNIRIPERISSTREKAEWIIGNHMQEWTDWKCKIITSMVKDITAEVRKVKPDIIINVHAVPWRENDFGGAIKIIAGQNFAEIAQYTDFLSPMCYSHMLKRKPSWINSVVRDIYSQTDSKIIPSIQVKEAYLKDKLSTSEFRKSLAEALKAPSKGVVFWSWEALEKDPEKKEVIKDLIKTKAKKNKKLAQHFFFFLRYR